MRSKVHGWMVNDVEAVNGGDKKYCAVMDTERSIIEAQTQEFAKVSPEETLETTMTALGAPVDGLTDAMKSVKMGEVAYDGDGTTAKPGVKEILAASSSKTRLARKLLPALAKLAIKGMMARREAAKAESLEEAKENLDELKAQASCQALVSLARRPRRRHDCLLSHRTKSIPGRRSSPWPRRPSSRACEEPVSSLLVISH